MSHAFCVRQARLARQALPSISALLHAGAVSGHQAMHISLSVIVPNLPTSAFQACSWSLYQDADGAVQYLKNQEDQEALIGCLACQS